MNDRPPSSLTHDAELLRLIELYRDGQAVATDRSRLEERLKLELAARQCFVAYMELDAQLAWQRRGAITSANDGSRVALSRKPAVLGFLGRLVSSATATRTNALLWAVAITVNLGLVIALARAVAPDLSRRMWRLTEFAVTTTHPSVNAQTVGQLLHSNDCVWDMTARPSPARELLAGVPLRLESGVAELRFTDGARVILEGPCQFMPQTAGRGRLERGKLLAQVPAEAIGFCIVTPTARIIDLGTEFGVIADSQGATNVYVVKGKVELQSKAKSSESSLDKPIVLKASESRRIEPTGIVTDSAGAFNPEILRRSLMPKNSTPIPFVGAFASSHIEKTRGANHLVDGSGLHGAAHTDAPENTMWHSTYGKVKDEFVLFDLNRAYRLDAIKVWNYNEHRFREEEKVGEGTRLFARRGVARASIYVSSSGKGDPISQPDAWQLIIADQEFSIATGMPDYATPDVIAMNGVKARFVAIVIADHLDQRPDSVKELPCVGLSEVQFFGERAGATPLRK